MANGHGGRRPGAGRKAGQVSAAKRDIAERAKEHGDAALDVLIEIARDNQQPAAARVSAANAILDRGYGKAPQALEHTSPDGSMTPRDTGAAVLAALSRKHDAE